MWAAACHLRTVCMGEAAALGSEAGAGQGCVQLPQCRAEPITFGLLPLLQAIK